MIKNMVFFLILLLLSNTSFAEVFYKTKYTIKENDTFTSILKKYVKEKSIINAKSPMIHKTRSANPHIKSWAKLKPGKKIILFISKKFLDITKIKSTKKKNKILKMKVSGFHSSAFYMASVGSFNQKNDLKGVNIDFTQNSFLSLGYTGLYYPKRKTYSFSSSIYFSTLNASQSNLNQEVSISPEVGINAYVDYSFNSFSLFTGIDFEKFSTFNTDVLSDKSLLKPVESQITYLTIGMNKLFKIWTKKIFTKLSISKSLSTSTDFSSYETPPSQGYDGFRVMLYLNYKFKKKWFVHSLIKFHAMDGPDSLSVIRAGLGFGYIIN